MAYYKKNWQELFSGNKFYEDIISDTYLSFFKKSKQDRSNYLNTLQNISKTSARGIQADWGGRESNNIKSDYITNNILCGIELISKFPKYNYESIKK
jgi:hypothetical protein